MKTPKLKPLYAMMIAASLISPVAAFAVTSNADKTAMQTVTHEMSTTAQAVKGYTAAQRDQAIKQIQATLDKFDAEIARIESRISDQSNQLDKAAQEKASASLASIKQQRSQVAQWYNNMQHSTADAWQNVKTGFLKSYVSLQETFDKAQKDL